MVIKRMGQLAVGAFVISLCVDAALADSVSTRSQKKLLKSQLAVLDNRAAEQYKNSVRLQPPSIYTPSKNGSGAYAGKYHPSVF